MVRSRLTIAQTMAVVLFAGFVFAALSKPGPMWAVASFYLAIVLLSAAPVVAWARKDESRFLWAAFAAAGWVRISFWWLARGVDFREAVAPSLPFAWHARRALPVDLATPLVGGGPDDFLHTSTYLEAVLVGLLAAAVCRFAMGIGRASDRRQGEADA